MHIVRDDDSDIQERGKTKEGPAMSRDRQLDEQIAQLRDQGASWLEIQSLFGLSRQQARYSYQRGKREQRRSARQST